MIWVASGSSLAFQRLSRDSVYAILSVRLAETRFRQKRNVHSVTESRSATYDVGGGGGGFVAVSLGAGLLLQQARRRPGRKAHRSLERRWAGRAGGGWRRGGPFFSRIPPWRAHFARFSRVRAAMRTAPGARKVWPDDTDELRELLPDATHIICAPGARACGGPDRGAKAGIP
eukprot:gene9151-biopygen6189